MKIFQSIVQDFRCHEIGDRITKKYFDDATNMWTATLKSLNEALEEREIESKGGKNSVTDLVIMRGVTVGTKILKTQLLPRRFNAR